MIRWKPGLAGLVLVLLLGSAGCKQQLFLSEADVDHYQKLGLPAHVENDPHATLLPDKAAVDKPTTILDPDRPIRYLSLSEAISIGLKQGRVGSQSPLFPGINNDQLVAFGGRTIAGDDAIRVVSLDPATAAADIEASLSKFDTRFIASMTWNKNDQAVANVLQNFQNGDAATLSTALVKPLPTGGTAGITFNTNYTRLSQPPSAQLINPAYRPQLQFGFEQPLLQNFGVQINQLNSAHPGSRIFTGLGAVGGRVEGVLITRLRFDQSRTELERNVNFLLLNVEFAYWNLYGAYFNLYSRDQALRQSFEAYKVSKARFETGRISIQDFQQTRAQFELFRSQRITALGTVLDNERQIRGLLGLPPEDGCRIVPSDTPTLAPFNPDWCQAVDEALSHRPELILARQDLKFRQLDLIAQRNLLRPDLRFNALYDINGIGNRLDGPTLQDDQSTPRNALASLSRNQFNNWQLGLNMIVPIGTRDAHSLVRQARLNLTRSYLVLKDQESKAMLFLTREYRRLFEFYEQARTLRAQREANAVQLDARFKEFLIGRGTLDILLEAQRNWADSLASEYQAIVNYNNTLASFQFAKGTLMQYDNVVIGEGDLPEPIAVRADDNFRARQASLEKRTRPDPSDAAAATWASSGEQQKHNGSSYGKPFPAKTHELPPVPDMLEKIGNAPELNDPVPGGPAGGPAMQAAPALPTPPAPAADLAPAGALAPAVGSPMTGPAVTGMTAVPISLPPTAR
jgi:outer membrane protein TolC